MVTVQNLILHLIITLNKLHKMKALQTLENYNLKKKNHYDDIFATLYQQ